MSDGHGFKKCSRCGEGIYKTKYENVLSLRRLDPLNAHWNVEYTLCMECFYNLRDALPAFVKKISQRKGERS